MAKFSGTIGFVVTEETSPGVHEEVSTEVPYTGNTIKSAKRFSESGDVIKNIVLTNRISILADSFAVEHMSNIRYVRIRGIPWSIISVDYEYPRMTLAIGEVYNG
jgi:hypothetical protein